MKRFLVIVAFSVGGLLVLGVLAQQSVAVRVENPVRPYFHNGWAGLSLAACLATSLVPYYHLRRCHLPLLLFLGTTGLLVAVLFGPEINSSHRWLRYGGQPSELAKLALVLALAHYGARHLAVMKQFGAGFLVPAGGMGLICGLIFLEPDWGTAILVGAVGLSLLLAAGTRWGWILATVAVATAALYGLVHYHPERAARLPILVERLTGDHRSVWQVWQSILSLASGGLTGTSPGWGPHKFGFVPEQQTDFILSLIGEELGFVGTSLVVLLFGSLVWGGLLIAFRTEEPFGYLLALGITLTIGLQAVINLGVVTNVLPNKGLPLPFVSYGGSNLLSLSIGVGVLASIARFAPRSATPAAPALGQADAKPAEELAPTRSPTPGVPMWHQRQLLRLLRGPSWPCQQRPRHAYQVPPVTRPRRPLGRLRRCVERLLPADYRRPKPSPFASRRNEGGLT